MSDDDDDGDDGDDDDDGGGGGEGAGAGGDGDGDDDDDDDDILGNPMFTHTCIHRTHESYAVIYCMCNVYVCIYVYIYSI